jgi:hypothetical protein
MRLLTRFEVGVILGAALVVCGGLPSTALAANVARANATVTTNAPPALPETASKSQVTASSAAAAVSLGSESADANVFVDFGILRASAFVSRGAGSASASASGVWEDSLTLSSLGFIGQHAEMTISVAVDGFLDPLGGTISEFLHEIKIAGTSIGTVTNRINVIYSGADQLNGARPTLTRGLGAGESSFLPGSPFFISTVRNIRFSFTMGDPLNITGTIGATANDVPLSGIPGSADVNFFSTSKWMGVSGLRAIDPVTGQFVDLDVSEVDFESQSGQDYRFAIAPVPLPGAVGMLGIGLLALLRHRARAA